MKSKSRNNKELKQDTDDELSEDEDEELMRNDRNSAAISRGNIIDEEKVKLAEVHKNNKEITNIPPK